MFKSLGSTGFTNQNILWLNWYLLTPPWHSRWRELITTVEVVWWLRQPWLEIIRGVTMQDSTQSNKIFNINLQLIIGEEKMPLWWFRCKTQQQCLRYILRTSSLINSLGRPFTLPIRPNKLTVAKGLSSRRELSGNWMRIICPTWQGPSTALIITKSWIW